MNIAGCAPCYAPFGPGRPNPFGFNSVPASFLPANPPFGSQGPGGLFAPVPAGGMNPSAGLPPGFAPLPPGLGLPPGALIPQGGTSPVAASLPPGLGLPAGLGLPFSPFTNGVAPPSFTPAPYSFASPLFLRGGAMSPQVSGYRYPSIGATTPTLTERVTTFLQTQNSTVPVKNGYLLGGAALVGVALVYMGKGKKGRRR